MARLCERPGCSEVAAVAYGMQPEDLVFWLDVVRPGDEHHGGRLCRMHADSMVVPRNWTLNDLRDPDLHLFRPPPIKRAPKQRARRSHRDDTPAGIEQLSLTVVADETAEAQPPGPSTESLAEPVVDVPARPASERQDHDEPRSAAGPPAAPVVEPDAVPDVAPDAVPDVEAGGELDGAPTPWRPDFDSGDDLDGLLSARSPLLARAFRGSERRR